MKENTVEAFGFLFSDDFCGLRLSHSVRRKEVGTLRTEFFKNYVASKTLKTRLRLVKWLSPKIAWSLEQQQTMSNYVARTPRPMILVAKKHFAGRQDLRGIEIGVAKAENALSILQELPIEKLFLIDPYIPYEDALGRTDYSAEYAAARAKLSEYPQVVWLRKTSEAASKELRNEEPVDFVYIDGNHSFEFVKKDIMLYYPSIRNNGLIGGHDYTPFYESVMRAVNEFAEQTQLGLHSVLPDWWLVVRHEKHQEWEKPERDILVESSDRMILAEA